MDREHRVAADATQCLDRGQPGIACHQLPGALEQEERGMAFVEVPDGRPDPERPQGADAADAEHDLLREPHLAATDVQDVADRPVGGIVPRHVGVEQQERHAPDLRQPHRGAHLAIGKVDAHLECRPVAPSNATEGKL
jgi:hypothetical protein